MIRISNVRNTTKFKRSIRAISPVIATLLMIAIAVVASLVVYAWVTGYMGNTTSKAGKAIQIQSFASSGGNLIIYVQNVGQGDVELDKDQSVYVNNDLVSFSSATQRIPIPVGQTVELQTDEPYTAGTKVNIKVTTTDGTFMTATGIPKTTNPTTPATTYAVDFVLGSGGLSMNPAAGPQNVGGTITISATPNTNYVFDQWQSTGSIIITDPASASTTATVSGTGTITATFTYSPGTYQVTVTADPSAAIGGTFSVTYTKGGTVHTNEAQSTSWTEDVDVSTTVTVSNPGSITGYTFNSYTPTSGSLSSAGTITLTYTQNQALQPIYIATSGEQHAP